ncbi:hypothetical protein LTR17_001550 [Elasticomyces elasticus]|nr:hypothetical protein LTR17_001550 [Elasticomyces elasticus]
MTDDYPDACVKYIKSRDGHEFGFVSHFGAKAFPFAEETVRIQYQLDSQYAGFTLYNRDRMHRHNHRDIQRGAIRITPHGLVTQPMLFSELLISNCDVEVVEDQYASTRTTDRSGGAGATDSAGRVNSTAEIIDLCEDD